MPKSKKIILDTNFLLIPGQLHVDIFEELGRICHFPYQLFILDKTKEELENIRKTHKGQHKTSANIAIEMINNYGIHIIDTKDFPPTMYADTILRALGEQDEKYIIATQDIELRKNFKKYIILRQKKYLQLKER